MLCQWNAQRPSGCWRPLTPEILGLDALGLSEVEIAAEIDLDVVSVGPLLAVARAKLDALEALAEPDLGETAETRGS